MRRGACLLCGLVLACLCLGATLVSAREAAPLAADEAVEQRLLGIAGDLRCPVCQNESLAVSPAALAEDLRRDIRTHRPPLRPSTWLLWGGPFVFLVLGLIVLLRYLGRRPSRGTPLSSAEQERVAHLLYGDRP